MTGKGGDLISGRKTQHYNKTAAGLILTMGGLRLRAGNTEPVMRVIAEAKDKLTVQKYLDAALSIRRRIPG